MAPPSKTRLCLKRPPSPLTSVASAQSRSRVPSRWPCLGQRLEPPLHTPPRASNLHPCQPQPSERALPLNTQQVSCTVMSSHPLCCSHTPAPLLCRSASAGSGGGAGGGAGAGSQYSDSMEEQRYYDDAAEEEEEGEEDEESMIPAAQRVPQLA